MSSPTTGSTSARGDRAAHDLRRLEAKGKGILLLHDIQPATVLALPELLRELKARGYRVVHVVPAARRAGGAGRAEAGASLPLGRGAIRARSGPRRSCRKPRPARSPDSRARGAGAIAARGTRNRSNAFLPREKPPPPSHRRRRGQLARADADPPGDPMRPFTSDAKPARNMSTPGKFITTEAGGWPPVTGVPVPNAGGVGVTTVPRGRAGRTAASSRLGRHSRHPATAIRNSETYVDPASGFRVRAHSASKTRVNALRGAPRNDHAASICPLSAHAGAGTVPSSNR